MSRIPQPSRSPYKSQARNLEIPVSELRTPSPSNLKSPTTTLPRVRTKSGVKSPSAPIQSQKEANFAPKPTMSLKETIALKRAEAKKAVAKQQAGNGGLDNWGSLEDAIPVPKKSSEDGDVTELGRWSVRETIERGRKTGSVNLSTRSLRCIPSALFEIHLGVTPEPLNSVPDESKLQSSSDDTEAVGRRGTADAPAWFEAQDLQILKAWSNEIVEIQPEICLFGSLKHIDLHNNKLASLPDTFADLMSLTTLDLSHNRLASLPSNLFALPNLSTLVVSHNILTSLPFGAPFADGGKSNGIKDQRRPSADGFFTPIIERALAPLPCLQILDASYNKLSEASIERRFPVSLTKIDFSHNAIGGDSSDSGVLLRALGMLPELKELCLASTEIDNDSFKDLFTGFSCVPFAQLSVLDMGETKATQESVSLALRQLRQTVSFDVTSEDPPQGTLRVIVGKKVVKEPWELEAERKINERRARMRAHLETTNQPSSVAVPTVAQLSPVPQMEKESWEVDAEENLLTEGGRRRARIAAQMAQSSGGTRTPLNEGPVASSSGQVLTLSHVQYFSEATQTLTLPPSVPLSKAHGRALSLASSAWSTQKILDTAGLAVPTPTLPLTVISNQSFAETLRVLVLRNRRMDVSFDLPRLSPPAHALPLLEELILENCGLCDSVSVSEHGDAQDSSVTTRSSQSLIQLLSCLFPSLVTLDLSFNELTSSSLRNEVLCNLILASDTGASLGATRRGLKHLRLRGNKIAELDGFQKIGLMFKGNKDVPGWRLEELDLRENEINKLPSEMGLLPLDVFLVEGNLFRVPQRRIWEREGTKGLLSWLRGRID